ncbi:hypothetical protein B0T26DRAFT_221582 [Lasiosphaeria miniovina]|uniref:Secreted protein n=1 Tax=Lasiosphaeria miniovina TaxID=1954250 RepID=A0AA40AV26_9PEZI|nr:uncharacterized protein B0T26DRAFT_221582 [Lasiosphaeria miniovina]KAK0722486.1 hypothetical protein B0T26DRAFT_221582 [Lasiosphaeria miniovina]
MSLLLLCNVVVDGSWARQWMAGNTMPTVSVCMRACLSCIWAEQSRTARLDEQRNKPLSGRCHSLSIKKYLKNHPNYIRSMSQDHGQE